MAKRVGVILAGCGHRDGSDIRETTLVLLALDRAGAEAICVAPDMAQPAVANHQTSDVTQPKPRRSVMAESARLARGQVRKLAELDAGEIDALIIPGGWGAAVHLSNYADKAAVCDVNPDVARLLKGMLSSRRPIGLLSMAAVLGARVLGPVAGVRLTLGSKAFHAAKHAAVMGADVRPCSPDDVLVDEKNRVFTAPASMFDDARFAQTSIGIERLVRGVLAAAKDRHPAPVAPPAPLAK